MTLIGRATNIRPHLKSHDRERISLSSVHMYTYGTFAPRDRSDSQVSSRWKERDCRDICICHTWLQRLLTKDHYYPPRVIFSDHIGNGERRHIVTTRRHNRAVLKLTTKELLNVDERRIFCRQRMILKVHTWIFYDS